MQHVKAQTGASASVNSTAKATIVTAIAIEEVSPLNFGKIIAASTPGKVAIQTDGSRTVAQGNVALFNQSSDHQAAVFKTIGSPKATYSLSFSSNVSLTGPVGSDPMTVEGFVHNTDGILDDSGEDTFAVGATLNVGAYQTAGEYTGTFTVTAAYN